MFGEVFRAFFGGAEEDDGDFAEEGVDGLGAFAFDETLGELHDVPEFLAAVVVAVGVFEAGDDERAEVGVEFAEVGDVEDGLPVELGLAWLDGFLAFGGEFEGFGGEFVSGAEVERHHFLEIAGGGGASGAEAREEIVGDLAWLILFPCAFEEPFLGAWLT